MTKDKVKPDSADKVYWRQNETFADLFNAYLYNGEQVIKSEELEELDTDASDIVEIGEVKESVKGARDVIKIAKKYDGVEYVLLAIENQEGIHYAMPIRVMGYDHYSYNKQYNDRKNYYKTNGISLKDDEFISGIRKTDKFLPVITLVLYYGEKDWDGPRSLYDMLVIPDRIKHFVGNYPINIIQMKDNDLLFHNQYNVDLFTVMSIVYNTEKTMNQKIEELRQYESDRRIDEKVIDVIVATTNLKVNKKKAGEQKMCTFWDEVMEYGKNEGKIEGKNEGLIEGKREAQYEAIHNIMESLNMSMEQAMDVLKIPESERAKYTSKA